VNVPTDNTIQGAPYEVNSFLDNADMEKLKENGVNIYPGFTPPDITGMYLVDKWTVKYDALKERPVGDTVSACHYRFSGQTRDGRITLEYACDGEESGAGSGGYISGANNCFTVYIDDKGKIKECAYSSPSLISGCLTDKGIAGLQYSFIMKSRDEAKTCDGTLMKTGGMRVISIDDESADLVKISPVEDSTVEQVP
jgi:hypothetical protein